MANETVNQYDLNGINDSDDSDSSIELEEKIVRTPKRDTLKKSEIQKLAAEKKAAAEEEDDEEEDDEEDIPMSDLEDLDDEDKEDIIPHQRLTINNTTALLAALNRISIPTDKSVPFSAHQSLLSSAATAESIPDVQDDLQRELAFYSQSLEAARSARKLLRQEGVPFSRPKDYFAEMIKEDAHMEKVKAKLVEEASNKKAAQEARKMRDLKKFGKQVQVAKIQERHKAKRDTLDKIKNLKRSKHSRSRLTVSHLLTPIARALRIWRCRSRYQGSRHLRRRCREGDEGPQLPFRRRPRTRSQGRWPQTSQEGREVRLRWQEAPRQVRRCHELRRSQRLRPQEDEGRQQGVQVAAWQGEEKGHRLSIKGEKKGVLIPVVEVGAEIGLYDALLLKEKATDEVQGLAFRVLLHVNRNRLVNIHIFCHHIIVHLRSDYSFSLDLAVVYSRCQNHTLD